MKTSNSAIAIICIVGAIGLMVFLFSQSRADPSLRIAALVAGTGLVSSLAAIASTLLTGRDVTKQDAADLPPGTKQDTLTQTKTQVPPITPPEAP